jgi:hypothetical protein
MAFDYTGGLRFCALLDVLPPCLCVSHRCELLAPCRCRLFGFLPPPLPGFGLPDRVVGNIAMPGASHGLN